MDVQAIQTLISNVGFPIVCVLGLGWFIYKSYQTISARNKEREDKLYEVITTCQSQMSDLSNTNSQFMEVLKQYKEELKDIGEDVQDIKTQLKINN